MVERSGSWNSIDESPQESVRTFVDKTASGNAASRNTTENTASSDSTNKCAKEMKMLGHDLGNHPNAIKGKYSDIICHMINVTYLVTSTGYFAYHSTQIIFSAVTLPKSSRRETKVPLKYRMDGDFSADGKVYRSSSTSVCVSLSKIQHVSSTDFSDVLGR